MYTLGGRRGRLAGTHFLCISHFFGLCGVDIACSPLTVGKFLYRFAVLLRRCACTILGNWADSSLWATTRNAAMMGGITGLRQYRTAENPTRNRGRERIIPHRRVGLTQAWLSVNAHDFTHMSFWFHWDGRPGATESRVLFCFSQQT